MSRPISRGKDISTIEGMKESSEDENKEEKKKRKKQRRLGDLDTTSEEEEDEKSEDYNVERFVRFCMGQFSTAKKTLYKLVYRIFQDLINETQMYT